MSSTTSFPWRSVSRSGHRSRRPASKGWESFELGHRTADLRHRFGARRSQRPFKAKETGEEGEQVGEQRFKFRRGRFSGAAAKEMARRGYRWRGRVQKRKKGRRTRKVGILFSPRANSRRKEEKDREVSVQDIIAGMGAGTDPLKTLVALQLTDRLKKDRRRARRHRTRSDSSRSSKVSSSSSDSSRSSRSHRHRRTGHAKAIESYQASKRRMFRRPLHHIKKYVKEVERELGAEDGKPYNLTDMGRKVSWGKQRNLQRCHFLLSDILEKLLKGKTEEGTLQVVLGLRAVHQAAIDGEWTVAWMLTHLPDVWSKEQWGGDPEDLGNVANYLRSMQELNRSTERLRNSASSSTADPVDPLPPKKQKTKRKGKGEGRGKDRGSIDLGTAKSGNNSLLEALLKGHGSFSRFLHVMHEMSNVGPGPRTPSDNIKGGSSHIFPSLLVTPSECQANSSRRNHRRRGRADTWKQEVVWNYFNFLEGGSPYSRHDQVSLAKRCSMTVWTSKHSTYAGFLHDEIHKFGRLSEDDSLGRGLEELNKMVSIIRNSQYSPGPYTVEELQSTARPVQPARMSLPEVAGIIDPVDHLKHEHLESFLQMPQTVPHDVPPESPTKGCFKVNPEDVVEVYTKLLDSGVATLIPESQALRNSQGEIISGGLFAVPHKTDTDRIICDRRPMNELERRLIWAKLPHGCLLTQIILPKECSIRGSGDDLSNYFYLLRHRPEWIHRNCVGKVVSGRGFEKYGVDADKKLCFSIHCYPDGWPECSGHSTANPLRNSQG